MSTAIVRAGGKGGVYIARSVMRLGLVRQLGKKALVYLGRVVDNEAEDTNHRVSAARCVVAHWQWREEREGPTLDQAFISMVGGEENAARWLAENRERLEKKLAEGKRLEQGDDGREDE